MGDKIKFDNFFYKTGQKFSNFFKTAEKVKSEIEKKHAPGMYKPDFKNGKAVWWIVQIPCSENRFVEMEGNEKQADLARSFGNCSETKEEAMQVYELKTGQKEPEEKKEEPGHWPGRYKEEPGHWPGRYLAKEEGLHTIAQMGYDGPVMFTFSQGAINMTMRKSQTSTLTKQECDFVDRQKSAYLQLIDKIQELNEGWRPDWSDLRQDKYYFLYYHDYILKGSGYILISGWDDRATQCYKEELYFNKKIIGKKIIEELGESLIKLALWDIDEKK
jgi:hypothetical protein